MNLEQLKHDSFVAKIRRENASKCLNNLTKARDANRISPGLYAKLKKVASVI